jgi:hypothetical protein
LEGLCSPESVQGLSVIFKNFQELSGTFRNEREPESQKAREPESQRAREPESQRASANIEQALIAKTAVRDGRQHRLLNYDNTIKLKDLRS